MLEFLADAVIPTPPHADLTLISSTCTTAANRGALTRLTAYKQAAEAATSTTDVHSMSFADLQAAQ